MVVISGWRAVLVVLIALTALVFFAIAAVWIAALLALIGVLALLNFVWLPRLARRLRIRRIILDLATLVVLLAAGWWLGATEGALLAAAGWVIAIGLPRLAGARLASRIEQQRMRASGNVIVAEPCTSCGRPTFAENRVCADCRAGPQQLPAPRSAPDA